MRVVHSPSNTLLDFDREAVALSTLEDQGSLMEYQRNNSFPGMANKRNNYSEGPKGTAPGDTAYGLSNMVGLTEIPVSSSSSAGQMAGLQPSMGYIPPHAESVGSFLAPEDYLSDQRASPASEAMGSLYSAWSSASDADMLRPSASVDSSNCPTTSSPYMQSTYFGFDPSRPQPSLDPQLSTASGLTPQQINQWCIDAHPNNGASIHHTAPPFNTLSPLPSYPTPEMSQAAFPSLNDNMTSCSTPEQWFSLSAPGLPPHSHEGYLSPPSVPSVAPLMCPSPTPTTLSDFDSVGARIHPPSPPSNPADLTRYGIPTGDGAWRCAHPGCTSQALFRRGCDLRKHFNRHRKHLFCRHEGCPQSRQGGFSSKKDRARHEAKHNPGIVCEWDGCGRVFSRVDNMKDHVRRIHRRGASR